MTALAQRWIQTLAGLGDHRLRVDFASSEMRREGLGEAARALDALAGDAEVAEPASRDALCAFLPYLVDPDELGHVASLRATALASKFLSLGRLLQASTRSGHKLDVKPRGEVAEHNGRPLTLGERRAMARQPDRRTLDRLLRDPHPMVAALVLKNPRIREEDVVRMAAHRPANPRVAVEIAKGWVIHRRVCRSLCSNPGSPPAVAVPLLHQLSRPELREVHLASNLPPVVRAVANELFLLRPPMPSARQPAHPH
ncbi:MAG: hypothetical protein AAGA56_13885 [Myxococcota bacterium]